ncbi:MAG TPA: ATP-binding cassette domain-containing protein [candidate division Zixibacteria bacterium]|nr:ATP-binding cassette domain-containing protein [candidate division Zixibacteria bacterium]
MQPIISMRNVSKAFGHVQALVDIDLDIYHGEVLGLLGDNGAGKSTLIKILSGVYSADEGEFIYEGKPAKIENPNGAQALGIATVYQDLSLVDTRPVAHNIFLGREPRKWGLILDRRRMEHDAKDLLEQLNINLPSVTVDVEVLSGGQRQAVAVSRAIAQGGDLLLLDEPTAALGVEQTEQVHQLMEDMKARGTAIILITHDLSGILDITDKIAVLRQGRLWAYAKSSSTTQNQIIGWITGALPSQIQEESGLT